MTPHSDTKTAASRSVRLSQVAHSGANNLRGHAGVGSEVQYQLRQANPPKHTAYRHGCLWAHTHTHTVASNLPWQTEKSYI